MDENVRPCEQCGQKTSFERFHEQEPHEGERTECCDEWVCPECICWTKSDDSGLICKDCCHCYLKEDSYNAYLTGEDFFEYGSKLDKFVNENLKLYQISILAILIFCLIIFILL